MIFFNNSFNLGNKYNPKPPLKNHSFVFIVTSYNNAKWYIPNLNSIRIQSYTKWRIIYVDDGSTDGTYSLVKNYIEKHHLQKKCTLIKNDKNYRQGYSRYIAFKQCHDDEICCLLDGDDWLYNDKVLEKLNRVYNENVSIVYGNYIGYSNGKTHAARRCIQFPLDVIQNNDYKHFIGWITVHLRTGKASLFKSYPYEYLLDFNDELISAATDVNEMNWVLSKSNGRHKNSGFITTVYNKDASLEHDNSWFYINYITKTRLYRSEIRYFFAFNQLTRYKHKEVILIFTSLDRANSAEHNTLRRFCDTINHKYRLIFKYEIQKGINDVKISINHVIFYHFNNPTHTLIKYAMGLSTNVFSDVFISKDIEIFNNDNLLIKLGSKSPPPIVKPVSVPAVVPPIVKPVSVPVPPMVKPIHVSVPAVVHTIDVPEPNVKSYRKIVKQLDDLKGLYDHSLLIEHETPSPLNQIADKIYCINLINNNKKLDKFIKFANKYNISCEVLRMTKVTDSTRYMMMFQNVKRRIQNEHSSIKNPNEFGGLLYHLICLKDAIKNQYNRIIIFEDNVLPMKDLNEKVIELKDMIQNKSMVYLGASQYNWPESHTPFYNAKRTCGSFAILLDKDFIKKIHDKACKLETKIDHIPFNMYNKDCVVMYPNLCIEDVTKSDSQGTRDMKEHSKKMKWDLSKYEKY